MSRNGFAGSSGTMDVPAPAWIKNDESLFRQWGMLLMAMIKNGSVETIRRDESLPMSANEFGLLIEGGIFVLDAPSKRDVRKILVQFLRRGDLFSPAISSSLQLRLTPHCRTTCLILREHALGNFKADFPAWERLIPLLNAVMAQAYTQAVGETVGRDQDRIRRVLSILASHPTATDTKLGLEIEAGKQLIRELAGVQKRSATRAFQALENSGYVSFYGYKRLFFKGNAE